MIYSSFSRDRQELLIEKYTLPKNLITNTYLYYLTCIYILFCQIHIYRVAQQWCPGRNRLETLSGRGSMDDFRRDSISEPQGINTFLIQNWIGDLHEILWLVSWKGDRVLMSNTTWYISYKVCPLDWRLQGYRLLNIFSPSYLILPFF